MTAPRTVIRWLLASLLVATLHPAFATAWAHAQGQRVEVCTSQGTRWVAVDPRPDTSPDETPSEHAGHCPFCRTMGDSPPDLARPELAFAVPRSRPQAVLWNPLPAGPVAGLIHLAAPRAPPS